MNRVIFSKSLDIFNLLAGNRLIRGLPALTSPSSLVVLKSISTVMDNGGLVEGEGRFEEDIPRTLEDIDIRK